MRKILRFHCFLLFFLLQSSSGFGQEIPVVKIEEVLARITQPSDTVLVVHFWATWCKPCVEELPVFIQVQKVFENKLVKFIYLSLDFKRNLNTVLKDFVVQHAKDVEIVLLDEPDYNSWIDRISNGWGGAIPATLVVDRKHKVQTFHEGSLLYDELTNLINKYLP